MQCEGWETEVADAMRSSALVFGQCQQGVLQSGVVVFLREGVRVN